MNVEANPYVEIALKSFIEAIKEQVKPLAKGLSTEIKHFLDDGLVDYYGRVLPKYKYIKTILHRSAAVNFDDIYEPLTLSPKTFSTHPLQADEVIENESAIIVIGDAGSGKSMLVKRMFLDAIDTAKYIPLNIELRNLDYENTNLEAHIESAIFTNKLANSKSIFNRLLEHGKFIIFLDGYDEINPANLSKVAKYINEFTTNYPKNKYVITSRPYTNIDLLSSFNTYHLSKFDFKQVVNFVNRQQLEPEMAKKILFSINEASNKPIQAFLTNPLLLSLYILSYKANSTVPDKKHIFYRRVVDTLFKEHDSISKLGFERDFRTKLTQDDFEKILRMFSFISYSNSRFSFEKDVILQFLEQLKTMLPGLEFKSNDLIDDLKISVGLWVEDGGLLSFAHRSIQEYFAALYVSYVTEHKEEIYLRIRKDVLKNHFAEIHNFLNLLEETDQYNYYKHIYLPALSEIHSYLIDDSKFPTLEERYFATKCNGVAVAPIPKNKKGNVRFLGFLGGNAFNEFQFLADDVFETEYSALKNEEFVNRMFSLHGGRKNNEIDANHRFIDLTQSSMPDFIAQVKSNVNIEKSAIAFLNKINAEISRIRTFLELQIKSEESVIELKPFDFMSRPAIKRSRKSKT